MFISTNITLNKQALILVNKKQQGDWLLTKILVSLLTDKLSFLELVKLSFFGYGECCVPDHPLLKNDLCLTLDINLGSSWNAFVFIPKKCTSHKGKWDFSPKPTNNIMEQFNFR